MKNSFKGRLMSLLLCVAMLLSLLPVSAAAAVTPAETVKSYQDLDALLAAEPEFKGLLVRYVAPNTGDNSTDRARIDYGLYKLSAVDSLDYRITFDTNVATLMQGSTGAEVKYNAMTKKVPAGQKLAALEFKNYPEVALAEGEMKDTLLQTPMGNDDMGIFMSSDGDTEFDVGLNDNNTLAGDYGFGLSIKADDYSEFVKIKNEFLDVSVVDEPIFFGSTYFKVNGNITADTFGVYVTDTSATGGFAQKGTDAPFTDLRILGFTNTNVKRGVKFVVYGDKNEEATTALNGATVTLTRTADAEGTPIADSEQTPRTFTTNRDGLLTVDGVVVTDGSVGGDGVLNLESGTWVWTVTPSDADHSPNNGTFEISDTSAATMQLYAIKGAPKTDYKLELVDGESLGSVKPFAENTEFTVTLNGGDPETLKVDADGCIALNAEAGVGKTLKIEKTGYVTQDLTGVVFNPDGQIIFAGNSSMSRAATNSLRIDQQYTDVTLTAEGSPAYVKIEADPNGIVTENMASKLPMVIPVGADGKATVSLPDGDYIYTVSAAGQESVQKSLDVANTGLQNPAGDTTTGEIQISDLKPDGTVDETTTVTEPVTPAAGEDNASTELDAGKTGTAGTAITDPLYKVIGTWVKADGTEWKDGDTDACTGMKVEVYIQNTDAATGTFGMQFDRDIFQLDGTVSYSSDLKALRTLTDHKEDGTEVVLQNPLAKDNYQLFMWEFDDGVSRTTDPTLLVTYKLNFAAGVDGDNFQEKVTDSSVTGLNFPLSDWYKADTTDLTDKYWRAVDAENSDPLGHARLDASKALNGGFFQTYWSTPQAGDGDDDPAIPYDTRSQFIYETFSAATTLKFDVTTGDDKAPVEGATVNVYAKNPDGSKGELIGTGTTDETGKVDITLPGKQDVLYEVEKEGFITGEGEVPSADLGNVVEVTLIPNMKHDVIIDPDDADKAALVGDAEVYNGQKYEFTLQAQPGYTWPSSTLPAPGDLTVSWVTLNEDGTVATTIGTVAADKLHWDAAGNRYYIDGSAIDDNDETHVLMIGITDPAKEPEPITDPTEMPTVTVQAGEHGSFSYTTGHTTNASTFKDTAGAAEAATTGLHYVQEQLGTGESTSAKYTVTPAEPDDQTNKDLKAAGESYEGWVIEKFIVNGTEMTLTDQERINGITDYQFQNISEDQTLNVTFVKVKINNNGTTDPKTDDYIEEPPIEQEKKASITVILSDFGSASSVQYNGAAATPSTINGAANQSYLVDLTGGSDTFTASFAGTPNVPQPDTTTKNYVVGSIAVTVNGEDKTADFVTGTTETDPIGNGVNVTDLADGDDVTIVVTFKPEDAEDPVFATLNVVKRAGEGSMSPSGISVQAVGLPVNVIITPASSYKLAGVDVTEPGAEAADGMPSVTDNTDGTYTYVTPDLKAGETVVGVSFTESTTFKVRLTIAYSNATAAASPTAARVTFTRASDGSTLVYGPEQVGEYHLDRTPGKTSETKDFELPAGEWSIQVSKKGYLDYTVNGFEITVGEGGVPAAGTAYVANVDGTYIIWFGKTAETDTEKVVTLVAGDATWDGALVALNDLAQVANGLRVGKTTAQTKRADLDESGVADVADMSFVVDNYGRRSTTKTYAEFLA